MQKMFFLGSILAFQTMAVHAMDLASITKVSPQEVNALVQQKAADYQRAMFGVYTMNGKFIDGHIHTAEVNYDVLVKEQVIPSLVEQRLALAKEQQLEMPKDVLSQEITVQVLAILRAQKK